MSCNESEWGKIHFTKTGYMQFIREVRKAYNTHVKSVHDAMLAAHKDLDRIKGRGATEKRKARFDQITDNGIIRVSGHKVSLLSQWHYLLEKEMFRGAKGALTIPRKSAFKTLTNKEVGFYIPCGCEAGFSFTQHSDGTGEMDWRVNENNHAVDHAKATHGYGLVMGVLNKYKFKRKEGGVWYYESEYTRDGAKEGGCGDSVSDSSTFGPIGEDYLKRKHKAFEAMYR